MKQLLQTVVLLSSCTVLLAGCGSSSAPSEPVAQMIGALYFGNGSYETYQATFQNPSKVVSKADFEKIRSTGAKKLFADQSFDEVDQRLRAFTKDEQTGVVYWADFKQNKSKDLHWNIVKTDDGWKIKN